MFGVTTSQATASVLLLAFIIFFYAANTSSLQNAFIFLFSVTAIVLIVGKRDFISRLPIYG
jgi:hypothetical protein